MAAYVIECLLKAAILKRTGGASLDKKYWHHDLQRLIDQAKLRSEWNSPLAREVRERLALLLAQWDVTIRYGGGGFERRDAKAALYHVEFIRTWLLRKI